MTEAGIAFATVDRAGGEEERQNLDIDDVRQH